MEKTPSLSGANPKPAAAEKLPRSIILEILDCRFDRYRIMSISTSFDIRNTSAIRRLKTTDDSVGQLLGESILIRNSYTPAAGPW